MMDTESGLYTPGEPSNQDVILAFLDAGQGAIRRGDVWTAERQGRVFAQWTAGLMTNAEAMTELASIGRTVVPAMVRDAVYAVAPGYSMSHLTRDGNRSLCGAAISATTPLDLAMVDCLSCLDAYTEVTR